MHLRGLLGVGTTKISVKQVLSWMVLIDLGKIFVYEVSEFATRTHPTAAHAIYTEVSGQAL